MNKEELLKQAQELGNQCTGLQRRFAEEMATGKNGVDSYKAAGGKAKNPITITGCAAQIHANPRCKAYLEALKKIRMIDNIMTREEGLSILSDIARTKLDDVYSFTLKETEPDENGDVSHYWSHDVIEFDNMPDHAKKAIKSVTMTKYGPKFELMPAADAIKQIRGMEGWDAPTKTELTGKDGQPLEVAPKVNTDEIVAAVDKLKGFL